MGIHVPNVVSPQMKIEALTVKRNHRTKGRQSSPLPLELWEEQVTAEEVTKESEVVSEPPFAPQGQSSTRF